MKKQKSFLDKPDSEIPLVPEDMDPYQRSYIALTVGKCDRARLGCGQYSVSRSLDAMLGSSLKSTKRVLESGGSGLNWSSTATTTMCNGATLTNTVCRAKDL
jgi:hypothetical protein